VPHVALVAREPWLNVVNKAIALIDVRSGWVSAHVPEEKGWKILVGTGRFELPTPRTPSECSTRLSHVPTEFEPGGSNGVDEENSITTRLDGRGRPSPHKSKGPQIKNGSAGVIARASK
jgi:hypothetical protein